jgi:NTE family protein
LNFSEAYVVSDENIKKNGRKKIGLAMGGGSVRGAAHLGVLDILIREGVPIDYVAGTSAGSILAALFCGGFSMVNMHKYSAYLNWRRLAIPDISFSGDGFLRLDKLARWLVMLLGDIDLAETDPPLAIVTMDAETGERVVLTEGPLAKAVQASCSIPMIFKPVDWNGRLLSDGGLVDNLPVLAARELGADYVIGVDIFKPIYNRGYGILGRGMTAIDTLVQHAGGGLELADCLIMPDLGVKSYWRFSEFDNIYTLGCEAAENCLPEVHSLIQKCQE